MQKKRYWWLAGLISIFCPGLGQIYNGKGRTGIITSLIVSFANALAMFTGAVSLYFLILFVAVEFLTYFLSIYDSIVSAIRIKSQPLKIYQRWYFYVIFYLVFILSNSNISLYLTKNYFNAYQATSASMEKTIQVGDYIVVDKSYYLERSPERGDVVVLRLQDDSSTEVDESKSVYVKRVIAIGGDTIQIKGTKLFLNDMEQDEREYASYKEGGWSDFEQAKVPDGQVFLLGDNRDKSRDSRYWNPNFIRSSQILGKAKYIYWPPDRMGVSVK